MLILGTLGGVAVLNDTLVLVKYLSSMLCQCDVTCGQSSPSPNDVGWRRGMLTFELNSWISKDLHARLQLFPGVVHLSR